MSTKVLQKCTRATKMHNKFFLCTMGSFGERLKRLREDKRMTQQDLADLMGKSNKTVISSWELNKNQPSFEELIKLTEYFETSTDYLLLGKVSVVQEEKSEYITIPKTELINLQRMVIQTIQNQD